MSNVAVQITSDSNSLSSADSGQGLSDALPHHLDFSDSGRCEVDFGFPMPIQTLKSDLVG